MKLIWGQSVCLALTIAIKKLFYKELYNLICLKVNFFYITIVELMSHSMNNKTVYEHLQYFSINYKMNKLSRKKNQGKKNTR